MSLEQDLRRALRKESPPAGFAERVAERATREGSQASAVPDKLTGPGTRQRPVVWLALAATLVLAVSGAWLYERQRAEAEVRAAEQAAEQVELALRITGEKLFEVQTKLATLGNRN